VHFVKFRNVSVLRLSVEAQNTNEVSVVVVVVDGDDDDDDDDDDDVLLFVFCVWKRFIATPII